MPFADYSVPLLIGRVIGLILGFTIHEWAHAWSAYKMGDDTARWQGRLRLDPRAHLEPIGLFLALIAGFGWARPVPVNPSRFYPHERRGLMLTALAGPMTNILIALFFALFVRILVAAGLFVESGFITASTQSAIYQGDGAFMQFMYEVLTTVIFFNLALFLFNLIPLSPLDGWKIMMGLLPDQTAFNLSRYERESTFVLMMLFMIGIISPSFNLIWVVLETPLRFLFELFTGFGAFTGSVG